MVALRLATEQGVTLLLMDTMDMVKAVLAMVTMPGAKEGQATTPGPRDTVTTHMQKVVFLATMHTAKGTMHSAKVATMPGAKVVQLATMPTAKAPHLATMELAKVVHSVARVAVFQPPLRSMLLHECFLHESARDRHCEMQSKTPI
jgi:hypothetical protein